jgi:hypothetical protein
VEFQKAKTDLDETADCKIVFEIEFQAANTGLLDTIDFVLGDTSLYSNQDFQNVALHHVVSEQVA